MKRIPLAITASTLLVVTACSSSGGNSGSTPPPSGTSAAVVSTGASSGASAGTSAGASSGGSGGGGDTITIQDFAYSGDLTVAPGTTIKVVDKDSAAHTLTAKDGKFDTGNVAGSGGTATFTAPNQAGTYALICKYHPQMSGTLTVK